MRLAAEGVRFKNYNVEVQCTPTRSAILSGRLPIRTGNCSVPLPGQGDYGLAPWEYTLGELFSDAGYATAAFGKWHVGDVEGRLPTDQGFDEWFGIKNTSDEAGYSPYALFAESGYPMPKIWEGVKGSPVTPVADFDLETRPLIDEQIAARAAAFIKRNAEAGTPFFTYVCFTQMHPPLIHHPDFKGRSGGGVYSDTIAELDYRSGQVLDAIDEAGIAENTIVVWCSDNRRDSDLDRRLERAVARPFRVRLRGRHARSGDRALAGQGGGRRGHRRDPHRRRLAADAGVPGRRERAGAHRPSDRRGRRLGVPPRAEPHDRTRSRHRLRIGCRSHVGQVENDEGRVPLQREHRTVRSSRNSSRWCSTSSRIRARRRIWSRRSWTARWVLGPVSARIGALMQSMARYPNIKPGEEFTGYS